MTHSDEEAVKVLRSIQRKIHTSHRANLLFPNAGRPRKPVATVELDNTYQSIRPLMRT
jgi:hypothetical protein